VFWFTILGWLGAQLIFTGPVGPILDSVDPELSQQMIDMSMQMFTGENMVLFGILSAGFGLSTILGLLFWLIHRSTKETVRKVFGILCGLMVATSFFTLAKLFPLMSSPEMTELNPKIVAASPLIFMLILLTFPGALIAPYLGQKFLHNRSIKSLHTAATKIRWGRGLQAFFVTWVVLFLKNKWVVFTITSLMFMAMHLANPEALAGKESGMLTLTMSSYFLFGFIACLMVWMDDGLESAIGFHAGNNTFAGIFVNYEGSVIPTPSLFMSTSNPKVDVFVAIASLGVIALIMWQTRKPLN